MKKLIILTLALSSYSLFSQSDSLKKQRKHELGTDITGLLSQFFNLNLNTSGSPSPSYIITYRYRIKNTNLRMGIGGKHYNTAINEYQVNGQNKTFYTTTTNFSFRLGYEFVSELSKKWQCFYGVDLRYFKDDYINPAQNYNGGYISGSKYLSTTYGLAPLLGFRFRINNRLSLTTEAGFSYNREYERKQKLNLSQDLSVYPFIPDGDIKKSTNTAASFNQPVFLILTVSL